MAVLALVGGTACRSKPIGDSASRGREAGVIATAAPKLNRLTRSEFNFSAVVLDEPLFWRGDANGDGALDPEDASRSISTGGTALCRS